MLSAPVTFRRPQTKPCLCRGCIFTQNHAHCSRPEVTQILASKCELSSRRVQKTQPVRSVQMCIHRGLRQRAVRQRQQGNQLNNPSTSHLPPPTPRWPPPSSLPQRPAGGWTSPPGRSAPAPGSGPPAGPGPGGMRRPALRRMCAPVPTQPGLDLVFHHFLQIRVGAVCMYHTVCKCVCVWCGGVHGCTRTVPSRASTRLGAGTGSHSSRTAVAWAPPGSHPSPAPPPGTRPPCSSSRRPSTRSRSRPHRVSRLSSQKLFVRPER